MRKFISILLTSLATLTILFSTALAHHHHQEWVHVGVDIYENLDCCEHADGDHTSDYDSNCVFEKEYITASSLDDIQLAAAEQQPFANPFLLFFINDNQLKKYDELSFDIAYRAYVFPNIPSFITFSKGLRAPPTISSYSLV